MSAKANDDEGFLAFLYNKHTGAVLGRTGKSWGLIFVFYMIYYTCLAGFFIGMISVLMYGLISYQEPMLYGQDSLLRGGPGLGVVPLFNKSANEAPESTLLHVRAQADSERFKIYEEHILEVKNKYIKKDNQVVCNMEDHTRPDNEFRDKPCYFPWNNATLGLCHDPVARLKDTGVPCVYLKVNKVYGWVPNVLDKFTTPLINCFGQNPADIENLGEIEYFPSQKVDDKNYGKISHVFFPYLNQKGYVSPLVAIAFPKMQKNLVALIRCEFLGMASDVQPSRFELMVDDIKDSSSR